MSLWGLYSQSYGFSVVTYGCELDNKTTESWRTDAFKIWCWRRLLRVPSTTRRSNQSILKDISPEYSLEGLMLKLKLQNFGHLTRRSDSLEKTLMQGKIEGRRRRGWQTMRWLDSISDSVDMTLSRRWWRTGVLQSTDSKESDMTEWLNNSDVLLERLHLCPV